MLTRVGGEGEIAAACVCRSADHKWQFPVLNQLQSHNYATSGVNTLYANPNVHS